MYSVESRNTEWTLLEQLGNLFIFLFVFIYLIGVLHITHEYFTYTLAISIMVGRYWTDSWGIAGPSLRHVIINNEMYYNNLHYDHYNYDVQLTF